MKVPYEETCVVEFLKSGGATGATAVGLRGNMKVPAVVLVFCGTGVTLLSFRVLPL